MGVGWEGWEASAVLDSPRGTRAPALHRLESGWCGGNYLPQPPAQIYSRRSRWRCTGLLVYVVWGDESAPGSPACLGSSPCGYGSLDQGPRLAAGQVLGEEGRVWDWLSCAPPLRTPAWRGGSSRQLAAASAVPPSVRSLGGDNGRLSGGRCSRGGRPR